MRKRSASSISNKRGQSLPASSGSTNKQQNKRQNKTKAMAKPAMMERVRKFAASVGVKVHEVPYSASSSDQHPHSMLNSSSNYGQPPSPNLSQEDLVGLFQNICEDGRIPNKANEILTKI
jgi:hypothetical protein